MKDNQNNTNELNMPKCIDNLVSEYRKKDIVLEHGHIDCEFFDSGNIALNYILSGSFDFGLPVGQAIEISGDPASGKSFITYCSAASFLKKFKDGIVILDDVENAYVEYLNNSLDIDTSRLLRFSTSTVKEHANLVFLGQETKGDQKGFESLVSKISNLGSKHIMVILDSMASLSTEHEMKVGLEKPDLSKAKILRALLRVVMPVIKKYKVTYIITNHLIVSGIGGVFTWKSTSGGNMPAYQSSVRLELSIANKIIDDKNVSGINIRAKTIKNRFVPPFRYCDLKVMFDGGLWKYSGLPALLQRLGVASKPVGGWYTIQGMNTKFQEKDLPLKWESIRKHLESGKIKLREIKPGGAVDDV